MKNFKIITYSSLLVLTLLGLTFPGYGQQTLQPSDMRNIIENNPDSLEIHNKYIDSVGIDDPELLNQYKAWTKAYPKSAVVPYAIGSAFVSSKPDIAETYLLEAVERDPKFVPAWAKLSTHANLLGDFQASIKYNKKAYEADTTDSDRFFYYASSLSNHQPEKYRKLSLEVAKRFSNNERGAQALYWLALRGKNYEDRVSLYQQLRNEFPPEEYRWSRSGMGNYFNLCLGEEPEKSRDIAESMIRQNPDDRQWVQRKKMVDNLLKAQELIRDEKPKKAADILESTSRGRYNPGADEVLVLLESKALDKFGITEAAYDSLVIHYSKKPSDKVFSALLEYGNELEKDESMVKKDIFRQFDKIAEPVEPFKFEHYKNPGKVASLPDYQGKVLLLTFWYPGCGPCRREYPHFQNVVNKFSDDQLAYVGVNIVPDEDDYVVPFVENSGYSFVPLRDNPENRGNFKVRGAPTNYLIDPEGRIIFSHFMIGANDERMLELMVNNLLESYKH